MIGTEFPRATAAKDQRHLGKADLSWQIEWPKKGAEPAFLDNPLGEFDEEVIDNAEIPPHLLREPMTIGQQALKIENLTTRNKDLATMVKQMKINLKKRQTAYFDCRRTAIQMSSTCGKGDVRSKWTYYSKASMGRFSGVRVSLLNQMAKAEERFNIDQYMQ